jgi:hypothetical protein
MSRTRDECTTLQIIDGPVFPKGYCAMRNRIRCALRAMLAAQGPTRIAEQRRPNIERRISMHSPIFTAVGVIQQVDPVSRQLPVLVDGVAMNLYVPLNCNIWLNDEPVKMRVLQPSDRARVEYSIQHGVSTAHSIAVQV